MPDLAIATIAVLAGVCIGMCVWVLVDSTRTLKYLRQYRDCASDRDIAAMVAARNLVMGDTDVAIIAARRAVALDKQAIDALTASEN